MIGPHGHIVAKTFIIIVGERIWLV